MGNLNSERKIRHICDFDLHKQIEFFSDFNRPEGVAAYNAVSAIRNYIEGKASYSELLYNVKDLTNEEFNSIEDVAIRFENESNFKDQFVFFQTSSENYNINKVKVYFIDSDSLEYVKKSEIAS